MKSIKTLCVALLLLTGTFGCQKQSSAPRMAVTQNIAIVTPVITYTLGVAYSFIDDLNPTSNFNGVHQLWVNGVAQSMATKSYGPSYYYCEFIVKTGDSIRSFIQEPIINAPNPVFYTSVNTHMIIYRDNIVLSDTALDQGHNNVSTYIQLKFTIK